MIADGPGQQDRSPGRTEPGERSHAGHRPADAGGGDVHAVGLAVLDDLGVAADDRDAGRGAPRRPWRALRPRAPRVGSPASSTNVTTSASARAPETARSFTVPLTASSPIEPPGNAAAAPRSCRWSSRCACRPTSTCAASPSGSPGGVEQQRREQAFDQPAAGLAAGAVRHLDLRVAEADLGAERVDRSASSQTVATPHWPRRLALRCS